MIDIALAFVGGMVIGLALGLWIIPLVVDTWSRHFIHTVRRRRVP